MESSPSEIKKKLAVLAASVLAGAFILVINQLIVGLPEPRAGEYYFSNYAAQNFTWLSAIAFFFGAAIISRWTNGKPFVIGIGMILLFPAISLIEGAVYRRSHNLLQIELITHALWALPSILGALLETTVRTKNYGRLRKRSSTYA